MDNITPNRIAVVLDCPDAVDLAEFYGALLEWAVVLPGPDEPDALHPEWVSVRPPKVAEAGFSRGFQRVDNYRAPAWPDGPVPQQEHLDFWVESIPDAEKVAVALGAVRAGHQRGEAGGEGFVVFLDPVGHPFCLCRS
ncbi:VOC family protein [Corynebacterium variabile]|uniref:VOC family protein n=1 Tax=Corynebacterium variabile TaxID=1727 RepID=UPI0028A66218|nr:VOC family protein [Corynebacterium variabile]